MKKIKYCIKPSTSIGEKQHFEAQVRHVKTLRNQFKLKQKLGAGLKPTKETAKHRVHWDDSFTAFNSRIRTGIISNLKHKDNRSFLTDCKALFERRVQNALKKDEAVKVNSVFGGEFELISGEKTLKDTKYFTTPHSPIYRDTYLDEWFKSKVMEPIMNELEEFQEKDSEWS